MVLDLLWHMDSQLRVVVDLEKRPHMDCFPSEAQEIGHGPRFAHDEEEAHGHRGSL